MANLILRGCTIGCLVTSTIMLGACGDSGVTSDTTESDTAETTTAETTAPEIVEEPGTTVKFGTPTIDGKLDELYEGSFAFTEEPMVNMNYSASGKEAAQKYMPNTHGTAYYLYDDEYLYVCTVVHDETICTRGEEWRMSTTWPWNDDGAEIYLWFSDEDCMAIHSDAHGYRSVVDEHIWGDNHSSAQTYHDLPKEDWAATIDKEKSDYTIEFRIKLPDYVKAGSKIGTLLEIDDRWAVGEGTDKMVGALFVMPRFPGHERLQVKLSEIR